MRLTVKIVYLTDEQQQMEDAGVELNEVPGLLIPHTFYHIDYIRPHSDTGYCEIWVNGDCFITNQSYEEVSALIERKQLLGLN